MSDVHRFPIRVYYEDTDAAGIVYYANYLKFAERARTEMMRELRLEPSRAAARRSMPPSPCSRCEIDYLQPARLDDLLTVETRVLADRRRRHAPRPAGPPRRTNCWRALDVRIACVSRAGPARAAAASRCAPPSPMYAFQELV